MVWSAYIVQSVREVRGEGSRTRTRSVRIVTETIFESLPLQLATAPIPIAPETEVVLVSGGIEHKHRDYARVCDISRRDRDL
jgi:hypothetical protein